MSSQAAQYRLLKVGDSTIKNTKDILNNLDALNGEIVAGSDNNDVSDYTIEPVYVNNGTKNEQRYFLRAKVHDFEYVGYLQYDSSYTGTDSDGNALALQFITGDNFNKVLANGKLYDSDMGLMQLKFNNNGDNIKFGSDIIVFITAATDHTYNTKATYIPETNEFNETSGTGTLLTSISPQITFAHGKQLYACSITAEDNENEQKFYTLVKIEDVPQPSS